MSPKDLQSRFLSCSGDRKQIQQIVNELETCESIPEYQDVKKVVYDTLYKITGINIGAEFLFDDSIVVNIDYAEGIVTSVEKASLSADQEPQYLEDGIPEQILAKFSLWDQIVAEMWGVQPCHSHEEAFFTVGKKIGNLIVTEVNRAESTFKAVGNKGIVREYDMDDFKSVLPAVQIPNSQTDHKVQSGENEVQKPDAIIADTNNTQTELTNNEKETGNKEIDEKPIFPTAEVASIRSCGNIIDVPSKPIYELKEDVKLNIPKDASIAVTYELGLQAYIHELRQAKNRTGYVSLENGSQMTGVSEEYIYQFPFDFEKDTELFDGARIRATIAGREVDGHIHAVIERYIVISLQEDCGSHIESCLLKVDNTAMLEALRGKISKIASGESPEFNASLAEKVIYNVGEEVPETNIDKSILCGNKSGALNELQYQAVAKSIANEVSYIWGPPGTGKTTSLTVLLEILYNEKKKVLLCSNTNRAVDQVLLQICVSLGRTHKALIDGDILRIGQISHDELKDWHELVSLDGIVARQSVSLKTEKDKLEAEIAEIEKEYGVAKGILKQFKNADVLLSSINKSVRKLVELEAQVEALRTDKEKLENRKKKLIGEKLRSTKSNMVLRVFRRSIEEIEPDIMNAENALESLIKDMFRLLIEIEKTQSGKQEQTNEYEKITNSLGKYKRKDIEQQLKDADEKKQPILSKLSEITKQLEDVAKEAVKSARIVGATVTNAYLKPKLFGSFDVVIVDEASMVLLPALYYVAGLAKEKVVISGDPKQLSPILQTEQKEIMETIGKDIFISAGIEPNSARVVMLKEQYRMTDSICQLISPKMYGGDLVTSSSVEKSLRTLEDDLHGELIIIDTSALMPFSNKDAYNSKYNLMNAITIRNYCLDLVKQGIISEKSCCGICTPYAAQSKLLQRMLIGSKLSMIEAGTVHRYQGDAKRVLIIDIPDSEPYKAAGMFLVADNCDDQGAKLFNVAISRARHQLIIVANLAYLDKKLPAYSFLRDYLSKISTFGKIVNAKDVIALYPIIHDLQKYGEPFNLSKETLRSGLFSEKDFSLACKEDMKRAQKRIDIFSGFITSQRISTYESIIREKANGGVAIRCITRPPRKNGSMTKEESIKALNALEAWGCVVDTRDSIHEKAVVIDGEIVWFGSLNPLSHTTKTNEMMARIEDAEIASQVLNFLHVGKKKSEKDNFIGENPRCPECQSRTSYCVGQYGPYWKCEECTWSQNMKITSRIKRNDNLPQKENAPQCPICGSNTVLRMSKFGEFYSCNKFPKCKGTLSMHDIANKKAQQKRKKQKKQ